MLISFELTMPNVGSWNGKWTGQPDKHFLVKNLRNNESDKIPLKDGMASFYYNFGDGWGANVTAEVVDGIEAAKRRKASKGFCGYDWMVNEIIQFGRIKDRQERIEKTKSRNIEAEIKADVDNQMASADTMCNNLDYNF